MTDSILRSLLYNCECAIFMLDIDSGSENFTKVKELLKMINHSLYPCLTCILVPNKLDHESTREISNFELTQYTGMNPEIQMVEISLLSNLNMQELLGKIQIIYSLPDKKLSNRLVFEDQFNSESNGKALITFRIILLGDSNVGKTSYSLRYFQNTFTDSFLTTIGINEESKLIKCANNMYRVQLWDTAGQEKFRSLPRKYYQNADGIILMYDVNQRKTFEEIKRWINEIQQNSNKTFESKEDSMTMCLIGNKIDDNTNRDVNREEGEELAQRYNLKYYESSCKWNLNINEIMLDIIMNCYQKVNNIKDTFVIFDQTANRKKRKKERKCC